MKSFDCYFFFPSDLAPPLHPPPPLSNQLLCWNILLIALNMLPYESDWSSLLFFSGIAEQTGQNTRSSSFPFWERRRFVKTWCAKRSTFSENFFRFTRLLGKETSATEANGSAIFPRSRVLREIIEYACSSAHLSHSAIFCLINLSGYRTNLLTFDLSTSSPLRDSTEPWFPQVSSGLGFRLLFTYLDICEPWRNTLDLL